MAFKKRGAWDRDPITRQSVYFVNYCPKCKTKVWITAEETQEFYDNSNIHINKMSVLKFIKKTTDFRLPKIKIVFERGGSYEEKSVDKHVLDTHFAKCENVISKINI